MYLFFLLFFFQSFVAISLSDRITYDGIISRISVDDVQTIKNDIAALLVENYDNPELLYDAGVIAYQCNEFDQAYTYFINAAKKSESTLQFQSYYNAGNVAVAKKDYADAINLYEKALQVDPENNYAQHNLEQAKKMHQQSNSEKQETGDANNDESKTDQQKNDENDQKETDDSKNNENSQQKNESTNNSDSNQNQDTQSQDKDQSNDQQSNTSSVDDAENEARDTASNEKNDLEEDPKRDTKNPEERKDQSNTGGHGDTQQQKRNSEQKDQDYGENDERKKQHLDTTPDNKQNEQQKENKFEHNESPKKQQDQFQNMKNVEEKQELSFAQKAEKNRLDLDDRWLSQILESQENDDKAENKRLMQMKLQSQSVGNYDQNNW